MKNTQPWREKPTASKAIKFKWINLNESIEWLEQKLIVKKNIPILKAHYYSIDDYDIVTNKPSLAEKFPYFLNEITKEGTVCDGYIGDYLNKDISLFVIKKVFFQDKYYVFESTSWLYYHAEIKEFNEKWIMSQSLAVWKPPLPKENHSVHHFIIQPDWHSIKIMDWPNITTTIPWDVATVIHKDEAKVLIINNNRFEVTTIHEDGTYDQQNPIQHNYGTIKNIRTDRNENFVFAIWEHADWTHKMHILNRDTLQEIDSISDIKDIIMIDEKNNMNCVTTDDKIVYIDTNFDQFPQWYIDSWEAISQHEQTVTTIQDRPRSELKDTLQSGGIKLEHDDSQTEIIDKESNTDDAQLRKALRDTPVDGMDGKTLRELYTEAKTTKDINIVYQLAQKLKHNPQIIAVKWLIDPIITDITQKKDKIYLEDIGHQIQDIAKDITDVDDFGSLIQVQKKLKKIQNTRSQIFITNKEIDTLIKETMTVVTEKLQQHKQEHAEKITQDIEKNCDRIAKYMKDIDYITQITSIYSTDLWKDTEDMLQYLDDENRKKYKKKMSEIVQKRQTQLSQEQKNTEKSTLQKQEETINEIKSKLTQLKTITESINDESALITMEQSDPLVGDIKKELEWLPHNKSQELEQRLEQIFKERILSIQFTKEWATTSIKSLDQYGIPKSLYFVPDVIKKIKRDIVGKPTKEGKFKLIFQSSAGNEIEPSINKKILGNFDFVYDFTEWKEIKESIAERRSNWQKKKYTQLQAAITKYKKEDDYKDNKKYEEAKKEYETLENKFYVARMLDTMQKISNNGMRTMHTRPNLPSIDNRTVITESIQRSLAKRWRILSQQLTYKQGIMIVESEAGTGKNFKCDILGHLTNREVFDVSCNEYMEKEDLLFSPEIDNNGTHRKPSKLVQWLQTPGAIIVLDEINTLKPWVSKLLNPLLDGRRYINDPQMGRVKAHPSVIIVGLMNPRYYLGTKKLPQEVISRARMTNDDYAPAQEEAFMISKYLEWPLGKLSQEEFKQFRKEYITKGQKPTDKTVYNTFHALEKVVKTAHEIRTIYSETKKWNAEIGKELDYVFTIRDGNFVIQDFNHTKNIQQALEDIIIPKIAEFEEKKLAKQIIEQACN